MKKKASLLLWIGILLVLIIGYVGIKKMNEKKEADSNEETTEKVLDLKLSDISALSFELEGENLRFVKGKVYWTLEGRSDFFVNSQLINDNLNALLSMESARTIEDASDLKEYGLDNPMKVVTLEKADGSKVVISFGDINDTTANSYVYVDENKTKVYTVPYSNERMFEGTLEEFRMAENASEEGSGNEGVAE